MKNHNKQSQRGRLSWMLSGVLKSKKAEGYVDTAVKVLIAVVVGALLLFGIVGLMENVVLPTTTSKVESLFSVEGTAGGAGGAGGEGGGGITPIASPVALQVVNQANQPVPFTEVIPNASEASTLKAALKTSPVNQLTDEQIDSAKLTKVNPTDDFAIATVSFNASDIASEGDPVAVYHYNEDDSAWENMGTYVAGPSGQVNACFTSLSPVLLAPVEETIITNTTEDVTITPADGRTENDVKTAPAMGDIVVYGDYEYCYGGISLRGAGFNTSWMTEYAPPARGWTVRCRELSKTTCGAICSTIFEKPVIDMTNTFLGSAITSAPAIPSTVENIGYCFSNCTALTTPPVIPEGITCVSGMFERCTSLTYAPILPSTLSSISGLFMGCTALTASPAIPAGVTNMNATFNDSGLIIAPYIPNTVDNMSMCFSGCAALTGTVEYNATINDNANYENCFTGTTQPITLTGTGNKNAAIAAEYANVTLG